MNATPDVHKTFVVDGDVKCSHCNRNQNGATKIDGEEGGPGNGDYAVCFFCGHIHQYELGEDGFTFKPVDVDKVDDEKLGKRLRFMRDTVQLRNFNQKAAWK